MKSDLGVLGGVHVVFKLELGYAILPSKTCLGQGVASCTPVGLVCFFYRGTFLSPGENIRLHIASRKRPSRPRSAG